MLASTVLLEAAVLLNDAAQASFTNAVLLPLLSKANDELERKLQSAGIQLIKQVASVETIAVGTVTASIPADMIIPIQMFERAGASSDKFTLMEEVSFIPEVLQGNTLRYWCWQKGELRLLGALVSRDVKLDYNRMLTSVTSAGTVIELIGSKTFLAARTAALAAANIGENPTRAAELQGDAGDALISLMNVNVRALQGIGTKRRPYRSGVKSRFRM